MKGGINMLLDLLMCLKDAKTEKDIETAYKKLERVGVDRMTTKILLKEIKEEDCEL